MRNTILSILEGGATMYYYKVLPSLLDIEAAETSAQEAYELVQTKLEDAIRSILAKAPRTGRKSRFAKKQVSKIINLAYTNAP